MIIGRDDYNSDRWKGSIYEILVFDRFLTDTEEKEIEWYLGQKWGVYGPTPPNAFAIKTKTRPEGRGHLLARMNLRMATTAEVTRDWRRLPLTTSTNLPLISASIPMEIQRR